MREAVGDVGEALIGERSDRGLLMASLAVRELGEMGATGHGRAWLDERVLEGHRALPDIAAEWGAPDDLEEWTWLGEPVHDWSPAVERLDGAATVRFFTYQPVGATRSPATSTATGGTVSLPSGAGRLRPEPLGGSSPDTAPPPQAAAAAGCDT